MKNVTVMISVRISATITALHIPLIPKNIGRMSREPTWNSRVRKNDMVADKIPLLSAVKNDEPRMEKPENKNENEKMENARSVMERSVSS